jgi:hypothetical protein
MEWREEGKREEYDHSPVLMKQLLADVCAALKTGSPHTILETIIAIQTTKGGQSRLISIFSQLPPPTFSELLRHLDPEHFVDRHKLLQMEISPNMSKILGLADAMDQDGIYTFFSFFLNSIETILGVRRVHFELRLSDYRFLLRCARATGDLKAVKAIWGDFSAAHANQGLHGIALDEVAMKPDVECYNYYLGAMCWHDRLKPHQRYRLRVIPQNFAPREWPTAPYTLSGHSVAEYGIKHYATLLFRQMVDSGLSGNEETFCYMMVALAREGDMSGVASILKRVWGVDVEALMNSRDSEVKSELRYTKDSPFYPSSHLLFAIAHVYCINNAIPTALRVVDYVSRYYAVTIPKDVWNELLQWTYVLACRRGRSDQYYERHGLDRAANNVGQLPQEAVLNLWNTMTSEPYNIQPTIQMYDRLIRNLSQRKRWGEMQLYIDKAQSLHKKDCLELYRRQTLLTLAATTHRSSQSLLDCRVRDTAYQTLRVSRNKQYMRNWLSILLRRGSKDLAFDEDFIFRNVPRIMDTKRMFLKATVRYYHPSGIVEFGTRTEKKRRYQKLARKYAMTNTRKLDLWLGRHWKVINLRRTAKHRKYQTVPDDTFHDQD